MKDFCENPHCENRGAKEVPVSVRNASDQVRTLCCSCEEVYSWGVQHGRLSLGLKNLTNFLAKGGFVILARNAQDPSRSGPLEAWAYQGPLDFAQAEPVTFGLGTDIRAALDALNTQLGNSRQESPGGTPWHMWIRVDRRELATILAALRFHQDENLQGRIQIPDEAIRDIATDGGSLKALDFDEAGRLCEQMNMSNERPGRKGKHP